MTTSKLNQALAILSGTTVIAHDRRKGDAIAIDHTKRTVKGVVVVRPSYGISNALQLALGKLASKVEFVDGMPQYHFAKR